jgi:methionyl-tRNA synthetase
MGKDNITFHSQIWPAELLAYAGRGARGGEPGAYGALNLPTEVVSSEFLTMEGRQFSSSRGVVIYVRDMLARYQPDALRYFIAVAGPESQDTDFTWAEFVRRTNDELVAGWGNLVNRTASMIAKNVGAVPAAGPLADADRDLLAATAAGFGSVGALIGRHRQKAAVQEAMRVVGEVNTYLSQQAPWKLKEDPERRDTVLHVAAQAVDDCNRLLAPFLPHSAQQVHATFGREGVVSPGSSIREVDDLDGGQRYPVLMLDEQQGSGWGSVPIVPGTPVAPPTPVFRKLDSSVVEEELARLEGTGG